MKKMFFVCLSLLLLFSCATLQNKFNFFGGKDGAVGGKGVVLKFIEAPDNNEEIIEGFPFNVKLQIDNFVETEPGLIGEVCLRDRRISRSGNDGIADNGDCKPISLRPADNGNPYSEEYFFGPYSYFYVEKEFKEDVVIYAEVFYEVQSIAGALMCVKRPATQGQNIPANCGKKQDLQIQQPDLPIKISRLTTKASSTEFESTIELEIALTKVETGQVVTKSSTIDKISSKADIEFEVLANNLQVVCNNAGNNRLELRQNENEKIIKCFIKIPLNQDVVDIPIRIKTGYGFIQSIPGRTIKLVKGGI